MNILHISPYYPDIETNHAGGVCMGKEIETLSEAHRVYVLTFISQPFDEGLSKKHEGDEGWQAVRISKLTRTFHIITEPWMPNYFAARSSVRFAIRLIRTVRKFNIDIIHAEYASMGQYLWIKRLFPGLKFNLIEHDMTAQSWERKAAGAEACNEKSIAEADRGNTESRKALMGRGKLVNGLRLKYYRNQLQKIKRCEKKYCLRADKLFTFNKKDAELIEQYYGRADTVVLNTYCGIEDSVLEKALYDRADNQKLKEPYSVCFLGQMARLENDRAAKRLVDICIKVKKIIPQLKLYIVGNKPSEELIKKAEEANGNTLKAEGEDKEKASRWITVTGFVEDVDSYIKKTQLAAFPLDMGAGIKVKVLRSLALGTPVITGQVGAEGIDEGGEVIMLAETDDEYENKIIEVLRENSNENAAAGSSYDELSKRCCQYICEHFRWKKTREILLKNIYKQDIKE